MKFPATREQLKEGGYKFVFARPCRLCDRPLEFYRAPSGSVAPLETTVVGKEWVLDSHFKTCRFAEQFRKKKPSGPPPQGDLFGGKT